MRPWASREVGKLFGAKGLAGPGAAEEEQERPFRVLNVTGLEPLEPGGVFRVVDLSASRSALAATAACTATNATTPQMMTPRAPRRFPRAFMAIVYPPGAGRVQSQVPSGAGVLDLRQLLGVEVLRLNLATVHREITTSYHPAIHAQLGESDQFGFAASTTQRFQHSCGAVEWFGGIDSLTDRNVGIDIVLTVLRCKDVEVNVPGDSRTARIGRDERSNST